MSQQRRRIMVNVLFELLKNPRRSDAELARILGVWRSTVTRHRKKLERDGIIQEYTLIPDLRKLGYETLVFWFFKIKSSYRLEENAVSYRKLQEWLAGYPEVLFANSGLFGEWNVLIVSLHKNFDDLQEYSRKVSSYLADIVEGSLNVTMSLKRESMIKPFSLKYLRENLPS